MNETEKTIGRTRELLIGHCKTYPKLKAEDIFKYLYQSCFGCEHLLEDNGTALEYIMREYETADKSKKPYIEALDGEYSRIYLSCIQDGLSPKTLARLFYLSSRKETDGQDELIKKLKTASELSKEGEFPFGYDEFEEKLDKWQNEGYMPIHHSKEFRQAYKPAYRVIANRYAKFLPLFAKLDKLSKNEYVTIAIEGGSASGKSTLANILGEVYDCNVFHTDDFFLRPEQRTKERFEEVGGNLDRERFYEEVIKAVKGNETVNYRPFDCQTQSLADEISVTPKKLTVVEGVYSMHTAFGKYYDLAVFLDIDAEYQRKRIVKRNAPKLAERFFGEWIPLENKYFSLMKIKENCDVVIKIE